ncbi:MAG: HAMP domain-containing sensor histidine kinase [Gammaproteobacteria bacterium]
MRDNPDDIDYRALSELREQEKLEEIRSIIATLSSRLVLPLYFLFWFCDLVYVPEYKWEFLGLRSLVIPFALVTHYLITRTQDVRSANNIALFYVFGLALVINTMIFMVDDVSTPYYAGLNLIAIGTLTFIPWTPRYFALIVMIVFGPYYTNELNLIINEGRAADGLLIASFFIVATVIISGVVRYFYELMRVKELRTRLNLQHEIKRRQEMEKEVVFSRDQALAASASKSTFLANMSHELRTPLHAIIGYSELLQERAETVHDEQLDSDVRKIENSGRHLLSLINNILDIVKIEAGRMDANIDLFHVQEVVEVVEQIAAPLAEKNNNKLLIHCPSSIGVMESDGIKLKQILINVLGNACKFTSNGTVTLTASSVELDNRGWVQFEIRDNGIGMSPLHTKRIFDAFAQADSSTTRKFGGTGLGLAISKQFSKLLGGDITVHSEINKGSVFTIYLPRTIRQTTEEERYVRNFNHRRNRSAGVFVLHNDDVLRNKLQVMMIQKGFEVNGSRFDRSGVETSAIIGPDIVIRSAEVDQNTLHELYNHYCDFQYATTPVILLNTGSPYDQAGLLCYHDFFPGVVFDSLIRLYERTQTRVIVLVGEETKVNASMTVLHGIRETINAIEQYPQSLLLMDPVYVSLAESDEISTLCRTICRSSIRLAIINPNNTGYKGFVDTMRGLARLVGKSEFADGDMAKLITENVVNAVRKSAVDDISNMISSQDELNHESDVLAEKA